MIFLMMMMSISIAHSSIVPILQSLNLIGKAIKRFQLKTFDTAVTLKKGQGQ